MNSICKLLPVVLLLVSRLDAQDIAQAYEYRVDAELRLSPAKFPKALFYLEESSRFDEQFRAHKCLIGLKYKQQVAPFLSLSARYRLSLGIQKQETAHLLALSSVIKKDLGPWETRWRIRYANHADEWNSKETSYIRFRALGAYDVPFSRFKPSLSVEMFQALGVSSIHKYRSAITLEYQLNKQQSIALFYKLDYYLDKFENKHIFGLNYSYKIKT